MSSGSFSTGQIFGYWPSWQNDTKQLEANIRDIFNGYTKAELYIVPVHNSLKDEVLQSPSGSILEYREAFIKAKEFKQTIRVKKI